MAVLSVRRSMIPCVTIVSVVVCVCLPCVCVSLCLCLCVMCLSLTVSVCMSICFSGDESPTSCAEFTAQKVSLRSSDHVILCG